MNRVDAAPRSPRSEGRFGPRVGIDASNLRLGGGITHLVELLGAADPRLHEFSEVLVWGSRSVVEALPQRPWLHAVHCPDLDGRLPSRLCWQYRYLPRLAARSCDVLLAPGGRVGGRFHPTVTMSRNMLPFTPSERARYGLSWIGIRLRLLRRLQAASYRAADGVIFLNEAARRAVQDATGPLDPARTAVVPHGVSRRFLRERRVGRPLAEFSSGRPFRWLYVSIVDLYKHQWLVARAVARLRHEGLPVAIDFAGPAYPPAMRMLDGVRLAEDPESLFIRYLGPVSYSRLAELYGAADGFVFASTCENMPNILLEAATAGLPIVCSAIEVNRATLGEAAVYFPPEDTDAMAAAMREVMESPDLRDRLSSAAAARAAEFTWERCARDTFAFLARVAREDRRGRRR